MATNQTGPVIDRVISRADGLAQLHINYARNANADLNSIMSSLANSTRITIPKINAARKTRTKPFSSRIRTCLNCSQRTT